MKKFHLSYKMQLEIPIDYNKNIQLTIIPKKIQL